MLPRINAPIIEREPLFYTTTGNINKNTYHSRILPNSHVIELSSPLPPPPVSQIGPLQINSKKFNVYTVANVESFVQMSHGVKDKQPNARKSITLNSDMVDNNEEDDDGDDSNEEQHFSFYFYKANGHKRKDKSKVNDKESGARKSVTTKSDVEQENAEEFELLKPRVSKFRLSVQEKPKEVEIKRRETEQIDKVFPRQSLKITKKELEQQG